MRVTNKNEQVSTDKVITAQVRTVNVEKLEEELNVMRYTVMNILKTVEHVDGLRNQVDLIDYRSLAIMRAMKEITNTDVDALVEKHAMNIRSETFWTLSNQDDITSKLTNSDNDVTNENSVVIFTTTCESNSNQSIFRSKIDLANGDFGEYRDSFVGKKQNDVFTLKVNGLDHVVTILGIRSKLDANQQQ